VIADPNRDPFLRMLEAQPNLGGVFSDIRRLDPSGGAGHFSLMLTSAMRGTKRRVALKVFHPGHQGDKYRSECFHREADLLQRFAGEHDIAQVLAPVTNHVETVRTVAGMDVQFTFRYFALELAHSDLGAVIATDGWDTEKRLVAFHQAARGIQRLHLSRIAHRDIKPPNFLVGQDRRLLVSDLGTARDMRSSVPPLVQDYGTFWPGDRRYTAPEMIAGLFAERPQLAFGADFFALGATLFELFTGSALFTHIFDPSFVRDLAMTMQNVKPGSRQAIYDQFVGDLENAHRLPDMWTINPALDRNIRPRVNDLYKRLCRLDYRWRLTDYTSVFRCTTAALLSYRHEQRQAQRLTIARERRIAEATMQQRGGST
jgi:serine/threonine protein kinase